MRKIQIKNNKGILILNAFLALILFVMFYWIIDNKSVYTSETEEPMHNGELIVIDSNVFAQRLYCNLDTISGLSILSASHAELNYVDVNIIVKDENNVVLYNDTKEVKTAYEFFYISFPQPLKNMQGKYLIIEFSCSEDFIVLMGANSDNTLNNVEKNIYMTLVYDVVFNNKSKIYIIGVILFLLLTTVSYVIMRSTNIEYTFAFLYFSLGLIFMFIIPMSAVPDETAHFLRAYEITEGNFVSEKNEQGQVGDYLSKELDDDWHGPYIKYLHINELKENVLSDEKEFFQFGNTALYSPFTYVPQCIGISIAKIFTDKVLNIAYFGRIFTWCVIGIILFLCVKYIPFGKMILSVICLMPMNMQECISLSADGFTFAIVTSFVTYVLYLIYTKKDKMSSKNIALLYILFFFLSSCKIVYVAFCLLAFLIPAEKFGTKKKYIINVVLAVIMVISTSLIWLKVSSGFLIEFNDGVDSSKQIAYILSKPHRYLYVLFNTIIAEGDTLVKTMFSNYLSWQNVSINMVLVYLGMFIIILAAIKENIFIEEYIKRREMSTKVGLLICTLIVILLTFTSIYVQWTPAYYSKVYGLQGRYFIPLMLPIIFAVKKFNVNDNLDGKISETISVNKGVSYKILITSLVVFLNLGVAMSIIAHFA